MKQKYQSELLGVIYEDALADFRVGAISKERLDEYAKDCLVPEVPHASFSANDVPMRRHSPIAAHSARN
ncbi:MAG: hypothetical protein Ta2A_14040 [Treponemataceae bacterium]|nr:MAG: hypothetical protein Ta2A_03770 [Treponemataceae bacterium]GMO66058.1 MAG: hypothetical protein Ta2A_14040 [Treponemataceae bacterium]